MRIETIDQLRAILGHPNETTKAKIYSRLTAQAVALSLLLFPAVAVSAPDIRLAADGKTEAVVVTSSDPLPEEATAAEWLAEYLSRVTGAEIKVAREPAAGSGAAQLLVGDTQAARAAGIDVAKLEPEAWRIKSVGRSLVLAGGRPRGTIYAVTEFLESSVGVRVLDPFTEVVPSRPTLTIGEIDRSGRPAFGSRLLFTGFPYGHPAGGYVGERFRVFNRNAIDGRAEVGDHMRMIPSGVHTFGNFISSQEFAKTHPEYFGMDASGKRLTDDLGTPSAWTQLCVTNNDVRRIVLERARQFLRDDRAAAEREQREPARWLVLSQNDNTAELCLCPNCKAVADREGSQSGPLLEFVNYVARELCDEFPDVLVQTEAYNFTLAAPKTVRPDANVVVRFCDNYGFSDPTRPLAHPGNQRPMTLLSGWRARNAKLGVWDYWRLFQQHPPGMFAPSSNVRAVASDLRMFHQAGFDLMTLECEDLFGAGINDDPVSADMQSFIPLRTWVGQKLTEDPERDLDQLIATFCAGYYGPAADPMRKLLALIEDRQAALPMRVVDVQRHVWMEQLCDATFLETAYRLLDEATEAAGGTESVATHIRRERIVIDSAFLWLDEHIRRQAGAKSRALPKRADVLNRHRKDWDAYIATVFDDEGQKLARPIIDVGIALAEKLKPENTRFEHVAIPIAESEVTLNGRLDEPFWQRAPLNALLPRDSAASNDNETKIRFAWTAEALYVGIEHPAGQHAASLGVALMQAERKGIQLGLYAPQQAGALPIGAYFYRYSPDGYLQAVPDRKSQSQWIGHEDNGRLTTELRFRWSDLAENPADPTSLDQPQPFVLNIEAYAQADSKVPSHVSSPWLIGRSPTWHSGYFASVRLQH